ncbi:hypothetical protein REPUB_Repub05bG0170200 [Reevesia pubescens]
MYDVWDPFKDFSFPSSSLTTHSPESSAFVNTRIDWKETPEAHVFKADLPGGKFMRRFRLPENVKMDQFKASMENGVLTVTVTVPKVEVKKTDVKTVEISA